MQWSLSSTLSKHAGFTHAIMVLSNLVGLCDGDVLLDSKGPVYVEHVFVEGQHEHDENEERVEHREVEHCHVAKLF